MKYLYFLLIIIFFSTESCTNKKVEPITPVANFTFELGKNGEAKFINTSQNASSYQWEFGDGESSTEINPIHIYKIENIYKVKLIVSSTENIKKEVIKEVIINNFTPKASFEYSLGKNGSISFKNTSQNAIKYDWSFGDGQISVEENPTVTYRKNGSFIVKLIALNQTSKDSTTSEVKVSNITYSNSDNVFVCDDDGNCFLVDAKSGDVRWKVNYENSYPASSPTYSNGLIFIGANYFPNGKLIALDIENGIKKWEVNTKYGVRSTPIIQSGKIFFSSSDWGRQEAVLYCLNSSNGQLIWETFLPFAMDSSPTIKDNNIYLGSSNGLYIIDADTGKSSNFIFKNLKLQGINGESSQLSSPCVNDNDIFYCYNEGYYPKTSSLIKYNIQNKTSIKLFELSPTTISSPTFVQNSIIINNSEKLVRFDITKLSNSWIFNFPKSNYAYPFSFDASPIVSQNSVFAVGSSSLFSIDLNSGKENWRFESGILTSPVYYDNVVYASSLNKLIALDSKKGDLKWSITIKNNGWSLEPSVIIINSEGKVFHSGVSGEKH